MNIIKLIVLILILNSCASNNSIVGLYGNCDNSYSSCTQIELKEDNTFEYFISINDKDENLLKGTWERVSSDTIKLSTYEQSNTSKSSYTQKIDFVSNNNIEDNNNVFVVPVVSWNEKKVLIYKRKLIFNTDKHWSMFSLKKTRLKNKLWN